MPRKPSSAGSRVIAAAMVNSTVIAAEIPKPFRKPRFSTSSPSSAMHTVLPANSTARPEVFSDLTAASSGVIPALMPVRCRVMTNSA